MLQSMQRILQPDEQRHMQMTRASGMFEIVSENDKRLQSGRGAAPIEIEHVGGFLPLLQRLKLQRVVRRHHTGDFITCSFPFLLYRVWHGQAQHSAHGDPILARREVSWILKGNQPLARKTVFNELILYSKC